MVAFFAELVAARRATTMDALLGRRRKTRPGAARLSGCAIHAAHRGRRRFRARCRNRARRASRKSCADGSNAPCPLRASELARDLALPRDMVEIALAQLEAEGQILRGHFLVARRAKSSGAHRRLLARIHRLTIGRLRREIEPVTTAQFCRVCHSLAAPGERHATARRRRHAAGDPAVAGSGIGRGRVGDRDAAAPHREL